MSTRENSPGHQSAAPATSAASDLARPGQAARIVPRGRLFHAGLCLGAFLATTQLMRLTLDWRPHIEGYTEKLEFYAREKQSFSILFVGSSRVYAHIDPLVFDEAVAETGFRSRSFNFGVDALRLVEQKKLLEEILRSGPGGARYLFIEPTFDTSIPLVNLATERTAYFHDLESTQLEISCSLKAYPMRWAEAAGRSALACLYHYSGLGRLVHTVLGRGPRSASYRLLPDLEATRGFHAQDDSPSEGLVRWNQELLRNIDAYQKEMRDPRVLSDEVTERFEPHARAFLDMARRIQASGVQPVFLITPGFHNINGYLEFVEIHRREADAPPLLSYLSGYEEIYEPRHWYDSGHMTGAAARIFSRRLGQDVARRFPLERKP